MEKCRFLPRDGMKVIAHGYVEKYEYGLSEYVVTKVLVITRQGDGILGMHRFAVDQDTTGE
jgi:hypothetical protein